jgi:hypothetical protein
MAKDNGGIIGVLNTPTTSSASGVWAIEDQYQARTTGTWPGPYGPYSVDFLVIAGGGSASRGDNTGVSGGGGAGGYRSSFGTASGVGNSGGGSACESVISLNPLTVYTITVGAGGTGSSSNGTNGNNSSISGTGLTTITSTGGGKSAAWGDVDYQANSGGSGGGSAGSSAPTGGAGTANQGYAGGNHATGSSASGGGGAGAVGNGSSYGPPYAPTAIKGNGGIGVSSSITGSAVTRAGGGGGGQYSAEPGGPGDGGSGGGGQGGSGNGGRSPTDGTANTGGGAGGSGYNPDANPAKNGGSGVVILRMPTARYTGTTTGSPTVTTNSSDTILTFTGSGSYTA